MNNKHLLYILLLFTTSSGYSQVDYTEVNVEDFRKYFQYEYLKIDGGELAMSLSKEFIDSFGTGNCLFSASIQVANEKDSVASWGQMATIIFNNQSPSSALDNQLYFGGLGKKIIINFGYSVTQCIPKEPLKYPLRGAIRFNFSNLDVLIK